MVSAISMKAQPIIKSNMMVPVGVKEVPDHYEHTYESPASTGKKIGVGIASWFIPGLGQAINGQWGKGLGFLGGTVGLGVIAATTGVLGALKNNLSTMVASSLGLSLGYLGLTIWSVIDAVKNAKQTTKQFVPKEDSKLDVKV